MRPDDACLLDMLLAAREALEFGSGRTFAEFEGDHITQLVILKAVGIVGEAAS